MNDQLTCLFRLPGRIVSITCLLLTAGSCVADTNIVWSDEFNGATIDPAHWQFETGNNGGWGNGERENYTSRTNNAYVANGLLHIVALKESLGGFPYTSARMKSQNKF